MTSTSTVPKATGSPPPEGTEHMHILIVEDNIINQTVLKRQIIKAGLTCDGKLADLLELMFSCQQWSRSAQPRPRDGSVDQARRAKDEEAI
jgi:CheY-like chemotaxis protein